MLSHRLRRWDNIHPALVECLMLDGMDVHSGRWSWLKPCLSLVMIYTPSKHWKLSQFWFNVDPASQTMDQHLTNTGTICCICWDVIIWATGQQPESWLRTKWLLMDIKLVNQSSLNVNKVRKSNQIWKRHLCIIIICPFLRYHYLIARWLKIVKWSMFLLW